MRLNHTIVVNVCVLLACFWTSTQAKKRLMTWLCLEFCNDTYEKTQFNLQTIRERIEIISAVSFEKYTLGPNSTLIDNNLTLVSDELIQMGVEAWPLLSSFPHPPEFIDWMRYTFQNPDEFIQRCIDEASKYGYTGYNLDWEPTDEVTSDDATAYAEFIDYFAKRLHSKQLFLSVDVATWSPIWNYTKLSATSADSFISMGTYTSTDTSFQKQLDLIITNFEGKAGIGLENVNASTELRIPLDEVKWRLDEIEKSGAREVDIWRMPVPPLWWPLLEKFVLRD